MVRLVRWFGFNGGSALAAGNSASVVLLTTFNAACAAMLGWLAVERIMDKHATTLGGVSGVVAGLVAITPACGAVSPLGALAIGLLAGVVCAFAIRLKYRLGYDDSLDVVGVHLVGGVLGTLLIGFLADPDAPNGAAGLFHGGGFAVLGVQAVAVAAVLAYSFAATWVIAKVVDLTLGLRLSREVETEGVDIRVHGEQAYDLDGHVHAPAADLATREHEVVASAEAALATDGPAPARD